MSNAFNFAGGEELARIGATWFVSYLYYVLCDKTHLNWQNVKTVDTRKSNFNGSKSFHKDWLNEVLAMNEDKLDTNEIGVDPNDTKKMARALIPLMTSYP